MHINGRIDKQNALCAYYRILFGLKKKKNFDTCKTDEP